MTALNDCYAFNSSPFTRSIASQDLYPSRGHREVQGRLSFALQERLPALVTGDVGTGKSTALRAFAHSLDHNLYAVVYLSNPHLSVTTLYRQILLALQTEPAYAFSQLLPQLRSTLSNLTRKGRFVLLIIDEAHLLPPDIFDQLRFLLNDEMDSASPLSLVLLGQPDLARKLRFAPYEALHQRIAIRYHLHPFDLEETAGYVKHHLHVAGCQNQIFSDSFVSGVYDHTKGVARKVNNVALWDFAWSGCWSPQLVGGIAQETPNKFGNPICPPCKLPETQQCLPQRPSPGRYRTQTDPRRSRSQTCYS